MSHLKTIRSLIGDQSPIQERFLEKVIGLLTASDTRDLEALIEYYLTHGFSHDDIANSYMTVVDDFLTEQSYFRKNKKYRHSTFNEVKDKVYFSEDYMGRYMVGLSLTQYLWPNHKSLLDFFRDTFPQEMTGKYLEVGPGHGFYFANAIRLGKFKEYTAVDLSPKSLELTENMVRSIKGDKRFLEVDFLSWATQEKFDAVVMGEVLEHVENPGAFLVKIHELTHPSSYIYITTCINSPAIDHIYLFQNADEVRKLITSSGLKVVNEKILFQENKSPEDSLRESLPINVGFVLKHAN